jgi:hypothetical protein
MANPANRFWSEARSVPQWIAALAGMTDVPMLGGRGQELRSSMFCTVELITQI